MNIHQLEVIVIDKDQQPIVGADVKAEPESGGEPSPAKFNEDLNIYFFDGLNIGFYKVSVERTDCVAQHKRVQVHPKPTQEIFLLHDIQAAYTFRGGSRVPYESHPEWLCVVISQHESVERPNLERLRQIFGDLAIESPQLEEASARASNLEGDLLLAEVEIPRKLIVRRNIESPLRESSLKGLRELPFVEAAGPIFHETERSITIFTNRMLVRFRPEVNRAERNAILERVKLTLEEEMSFAPNLVLVKADPSIGESINKKAEELLELDSVIYAEPSLHEEPDVDALVPTDFLWPGCWDRQKVGVEEAWEFLGKNVPPFIPFGSPDIIIAVVDNGIQSGDDEPLNEDLPEIQSGVEEPLNEDFTGTVSNGKSKTYVLFDFRNMVPNHRRTAPSDGGNGSGHGTSCAGVALAKSDNQSGVVGAAPNARLLGLIYPHKDEEKLRMFLWAAGLPVKVRPPEFPPDLVDGGADIFTCSIGFGEGGLTPSTVKDLLDYLTYRGRNGKGCLAIFSAGNDMEEIFISRPFGNYNKSFSCAASTLDPQGNEVRATYSNFGQVDWCAPSSTTKSNIGHNPPNSYSVWTTSIPDKGNLPSFSLSETVLESNGNGGCIDGTAITVKDIGGIKKGLAVIVGDLNTANQASTFESASIKDPPPDLITRVVTVSGLSECHQAGEPVITGPGNHHNKFGGTSAAAPLSAGICALVLSANPNLTWVEARDILYKTAEKIDSANTDPIGEWRDVNLERISESRLPPHFSKWYGHGRLNAAKAVEEAFAYKFTRDLMIRKSLNDTGLNPNLAFDESPDIWVRNIDPVSEPDSNDHNLFADFDKPGPHQTPSRGKGQWVYARVKNIGTEASLDAWVRFYVALTDGGLLRYPDDWEPKNGIGNRTPSVWERGVYFIGEVGITKIPPGTDKTINIPWPEKLIPPASAANAGLISLLLVEVLPLDGAVSGQNNNLAQKRIKIND